MITRWRESGGMGSSRHVTEGIQHMSVSCPARAPGYVEKLSGPWGARTKRVYLWASEGNIHDTTMPPTLEKTVLTTLMIGHSVPLYNLILHRSLETLASCDPPQIVEEVADDPTRLSGEIAGMDTGPRAQSEGDGMTGPMEVDPNGLHSSSSQLIPEILA